MDITKIAESWTRIQREVATAARLHPPQVIRLPLSFPLVVHPAKTILDGQNIRQQQRAFFQGTGKAIDGQLLREGFQRLTDRDADLVQFLARYGWWDGRRVVPIKEIWEFQRWLQLIMRSSNKFRAQQLGRRGLFGRLPGLLAKKFTLACGWENGVPMLTVETDCCLDAITATVLIDIVRGIRYKKCERHDCHVLFPRGRRPKRFCSEACQHLALVRRGRVPKTAKPRENRREGTFPNIHRNARKL